MNQFEQLMKAKVFQKTVKDQLAMLGDKARLDYLIENHGGYAPGRKVVRITVSITHKGVPLKFSTVFPVEHLESAHSVEDFGQRIGRLVLEGLADECAKIASKEPMQFTLDEFQAASTKQGVWQFTKDAKDFNWQGPEVPW